MPCKRLVLDSDIVFRVCHQRHWDFAQNRPDKAAFHFDPADDAISVYLNALIDSSQVLPLHDRPGRLASSVNGLLSLQTQKVREGGLLNVLHAPHDPGALHIAHSKIVKRSSSVHKLRAQKLLVDASLIVIPVPSRS